MTKRGNVAAVPEEPEFVGDVIGPWSELKLEIVDKYARAYSTIFSQRPGLWHAYIDGFAGGGHHRARATGEPVKGSRPVPSRSRLPSAVTTSSTSMASGRERSRS